jgi:adenylate cyclase
MSRLRRNLPLVVGIGVTLLMTALYGLHATNVAPLPVLERLEAWTLDARFRLRGTRPPRTDELEIVIVGLDDKVREQVPKLNQERRLWAPFLDRIAKGGPKVIAIDYIFDTPEQMLPPALVRGIEARKKELDALVTRGAKDGAGGRAGDGPVAAALRRTRSLLDRLLEHTRGDERMAAAFARAGNVVPAVLFRFPGEGGGGAPVGRLRRAAYGEAVLPKGLPRRRLPPRAVGASGVTAVLDDQAAAAGFVNNIVEADGATRRYYTAIRYRGQVYLPLALQALRLALGVPRADFGYVAGRRTLTLGPRSLPLDRRGRVRVNYLGPRGTFPTVSAADVLAGRVPAGTFRDKIVLIGPNHSANIDKAVTPFDPLLPGVELHATVIHNLLYGEGLAPVSWLWNLLGVLLMGLLATAIHLLPGRRRGWWVSAGLIVLVGAHFLTAQLLFSRAGLLVAVVFPTVTLLTVSVSVLAVGFLTEGREKRRIRSLFQHYLHADVIRELTRDPDKLRLGGERREVTVLFSDIRGFSRLSEQLDPQRLALLVNQYLTPMTDAVLDEKGFLDKYIGDAIMALFGAPRPRPDHAVLAVRTAVIMLERLAELNRRWRDEPWAPVRIGVGLNSGEVSLGNFGSERRVEYTAIGDTVNLASRLEGLNKIYGTSVLVGQPTRQRLGDEFWIREIDRVQVKGKEEATRIYEVLGRREDGRPCPVDIARFEAGLAAYRAADWDEARACFRAVSRSAAPPPGIAGPPPPSTAEEAEPPREPEAPDSQEASRAADPPSEVFLARIDELEARGVTAGTWDGVFVMDSK